MRSPSRYCSFFLADSKAFGMRFEDYVTKFEKVYQVNSTEGARRMAIYQSNVAEILAFNAQDFTYKKAINQVLHTRGAAHV